MPLLRRRTLVVAVIVGAAASAGAQEMRTNKPVLIFPGCVGPNWYADADRRHGE